MYDWFFVSTGDGARTHTWFPITDFESVASAIPPLLRISRRTGLRVFFIPILSEACPRSGSSRR